jgi:hypothetical protein
MQGWRKFLNADEPAVQGAYPSPACICANRSECMHTPITIVLQRHQIDHVKNVSS